MNTAEASSQNWQAHLSLKLRAGAQKTSLIPVKRYGPLSVQRAFYPEQETCHVYLLHPPGGVVGGDQLDLEVEAEESSSTLITTPGATKFYLSAGRTAQLSQSLKVQPQANLEFLPQENIYFPGAQVNARTQIYVSENSSVMLWEKHCFGRPVIDESFSEGLVVSTLELICEGELIFTEKQRIDALDIQCSSGLRHAPVIGTLLVYGDGMTKVHLDALRSVTPEDGFSGVTRLTDKLLLIRYMGQSTIDVNHYFITLWQQLRPLILQRPSCIPRIWNT